MGALRIPFSWLLSAGLLFLWGGEVVASTLYVKHASTRLLERPNLGSRGSPLPVGTAVTRIGEQGLFYQVRVGGRTGWVARLYLSPNARQSKVDVSFAQRRPKTTVRVRASAYTQTAAARGLGKSATIRVRGGQHLYDFDAIDWLEAIAISPEAQREFIQTGRLKRAP